MPHTNAELRKSAKRVAQSIYFARIDGALRELYDVSLFDDDLPGLVFDEATVAWSRGYTVDDAVALVATALPVEARG